MVLSPTIIARPLLERETRQAIAWAVGENWNPGPYDARALEKADPGCLIGLDDGGHAIGVISAVRMTTNFGYLGFFVLNPAHRRLNHGWRLLQAGFDRLGDRVAGGDGQLEHLRAYARFGLLPSHLNVSYQGVAPASPRPVAPAIVCASSLPLATVATYDASNFGVSRAAFIREWLAMPDSRALAWWSDGRIAGLVAARRCHRGVRIGPLQADAPEVAEALLDAISGCFPGETLSIDCPEPTPDTDHMLRERGFVTGLKTARLYRGEPPACRHARIYGLMSFALG